MDFLKPIMGDVLIGGPDGAVEGDALLVDCRVAAPPDARVLINGAPAHWRDGAHCATVPLRGSRCRLEAVDQVTGQRRAITVLWLQRAHNRYRFTVDDCIRCFEDLTRNRDHRESIFENPYLRIFHEAHLRYGSKVHINAFYQNLDGTFDLSMMTDRFRREFRDNADWLSITFHARTEFPDKPYQDAGFDALYDDCERCTREIERFAGPEVLRDTTTLHWGECNVQGVRALRAFGFKALSAYTSFDQNGDPAVAYHMNRAQVAHAERREMWADIDEDVIFPKLDLVLNAPELTADRVAPALDELARRPEEGTFIQMVIHEQYFYPDYAYYEPDYARRIMAMAEWMCQRGYRCDSLSDIIRT